MKILITGIHGFVGSNLVKELCVTHEIYGLDIIAPRKEGIIETYSWNDLDEGVVPEMDVIIHLAGKAHDVKSKSVADVYFKINTDLTKKIFDYYLASSTAKKFIFFSSVKAAADFVMGDVLREDITPTPVGPYGESKIAAEEYISSKIQKVDGACDKFKCLVSKDVYILRPCMIHGPGNKGNLTLLYNVVRKGIPWPLGAFENRRTFTSIDNLSYIIDGLLTKDVASGIYHIADDEALSTNELIALICEVIGKKTNIWHLNIRMMEMIAQIGSVLHLPLNTERLAKLTENYVVSNKKIKSALGLDKMPIQAKVGLIKTIKSFQDNN